MKLSENTNTILKNFSNINPSIVIQKGTTQKTMSIDKTIIAEAELEDFPNTFGIYDLNLFLNNIGLMNEPSLNFSNNSVLIDDGAMKFTFHPCSPNVVISPPEGDLFIKSKDAVFEISNTVLQKVLKLLTLNDFSNLVIEGKKGKIYLYGKNVKGDNQNNLEIMMNEYDGKDFKVSLRTKDIQLIPDSYLVEVTVGAFVKFISNNRKLTYYIANAK